MAPTLSSSPPHLRVSPEPLTPQSFALFGSVITTPFPRDLLGAPNDLPSLELPHPVPATPVYANQGSAVKISPISPLANGYETNACPSGKAAQARLSMFACFPRKPRREKQLSKHEFDDTTPVFDVKILERHPYTSQTFVPLDLSSQRRVVRDRQPDKRSHNWQGFGEGDVNLVLDGSADQEEEQEEPIFLVIVAPTLKGQVAAATTTTPSTTPIPEESINEGGNADKGRVLIRDPPDLENLRAFIARGGQAVTYGPGTWHAPMVVLGSRRIDFVVVQYMNGVANEDCQEAAFKDGIVVDLKSLDEEEDELWDDVKKLSKL